MPFDIGIAFRYCDDLQILKQSASIALEPNITLHFYRLCNSEIHPHVARCSDAIACYYRAMVSCSAGLPSRPNPTIPNVPLAKYLTSATGRCLFPHLHLWRGGQGVRSNARRSGRQFPHLHLWRGGQGGVRSNARNAGVFPPRHLWRGGGRLRYPCFGKHRQLILE